MPAGRSADPTEQRRLVGIGRARERNHSMTCSVAWLDAGPAFDGAIDWVMEHEVEGAPFLCIGRVREGYLVRSPGIADFFFDEAGQSVRVRPLPAVSAALVGEVLERQILPGLHQLAGSPALHASAVSSPGGTIAFVGPSGAGKSTLAALLSSTWPLVADDFLPLQNGPDHVLALPSAGWVRLGEASRAGLGAEGVPSWGKTAVVRPSDSEPRPLVRIYALDTASEDVTIEPMSRREGFMALASQLHRIDPKDAGLLGAEVGFVEEVLARTRVMRLRYPRRFDVAAEVLEAIRRNLEAPARP